MGRLGATRKCVCSAFVRRLPTTCDVASITCSAKETMMRGEVVLGRRDGDADVRACGKASRTSPTAYSLQPKAYSTLNVGVFTKGLWKRHPSVS